MSRQRTRSYRQRNAAHILSRHNAMPRKKGTDSKPGSFEMFALDPGDGDKWLSNYPMLEWLDVPTAITAAGETLQGAYARTQWMYEQIEPADELLASCVKRRTAALGKIPWSVNLVADIPDELSNLADRQKQVVNDFYNSIAGLKNSIKAMGQAEFRGYKILQKTINDRGDLILLPTNNWNWVRDGYNGPWGWNPSASFGLTHGRSMPADPASLIVRTTSLPIDHVAVFNVLGRKNTTGQWRVFNGTYGVPVIMLYMPEGISPEDRLKFLETARKITSSGRGVLPAGSKTEMLAPAGANYDSFDKLLTREDKLLVMAATGGLLTMLAESGSGTLAGSAHQQAFDDLADMEGGEIAECFNDSLTVDILDEYFPGEPHLVDFVIARPDDKGAKQIISDAAALAQGGYRISTDQINQRTGYEVTEAPIPTQQGSPQYPLGGDVAQNSDQQPAVQTNREDDQLAASAPPSDGKSILSGIASMLTLPTEADIVADADAIAPIIADAVSDAAQEAAAEKSPIDAQTT